MYHKFVNTTPKPSATKNKSGLLVGPSLLLLFAPVVVGPGGALDAAVGGIVEAGEAVDMMMMWPRSDL